MAVFLVEERQLELEMTIHGAIVQRPDVTVDLSHRALLEKRNDFCMNGLCGMCPALQCFVLQTIYGCIPKAISVILHHVPTTRTSLGEGGEHWMVVVEDEHGISEPVQESCDMSLENIM